MNANKHETQDTKHETRSGSPIRPFADSPIRLNRRRRGSVIVLVVAVLALLVVIGTIYIVSARTERGSASAASTSVNRDWARDAGMNVVLNKIQTSAFNAQGTLGGLGPRTSRWFDCPPEVVVNGVTPYDLTNANLNGDMTSYNGLIPNEAWLVAGLYRAAGNPLGAPATPADSDVSIVGPYALDTTSRSPSGPSPTVYAAFFNPLTGGYDIRLTDVPTGWSTNLPSLQKAWPAGQYLCNVVADPLPAAVLNTLGIVADPTVLATNQPLGTGFAAADGIFNLLPFSEASGIRYRVAFRIIDTSRMANLNTGAPGVPPSPLVNIMPFFNSPVLDYSGAPYRSYAGTGTYITSYNLAAPYDSFLNPIPGVDLAGNVLGVAAQPYVQTLLSPNNFAAAPPPPGDDPRVLHLSRKGNTGLPLMPPAASFIPGFFSYDTWQREILTSEFCAANPGYDLQLLGIPLGGGVVNLFDASDELSLRAYGNWGTSYTSRPASPSIWFNTLGNVAISGGNLSSVVTGNVRRGSYTTISESRDLRPYADPVLPHPNYALTPSLAVPNAPAGYPVLAVPGYFARQTWPPSPAKVSANPALYFKTDLYSFRLTAQEHYDAAYYLAMAATNLVTAMEASGYSFDEARAFAANYMTYRWNSGCYVNGIISQGKFLPAKTWDPSTGDYSGADIGLYSMPHGPSFIDDQGICIRAMDLTRPLGPGVNREFGGPALPLPPAPTPQKPGAPYDVRSGPASPFPLVTPPTATNRVYLGYAAQPFISKVAVEITSNNNSTDITDSAVELYNPYNVPLCLDGFYLRTGNGNEVDLSVNGAGKPNYIPAGGYFVVVEKSGGNLDKAVYETAAVNANDPLPAPKMADANLHLEYTKGNLNQEVVLLRRYIPRSTRAAQYNAQNPAPDNKVPVDRFDYTALTSNSASAPSAGIHYVQRPNRDNRLPSQIDPRRQSPPTAYTPDLWLPSVSDPSLESQVDPVALSSGGPGQFLGVSNKFDFGVTYTAVALYDRYADTSALPLLANGTTAPVAALPLPAAGQSGPLKNIREFNRIMRVCNIVSGDTSAFLPGQTVKDINPQTLSNSQIPGMLTAHLGDTYSKVDAYAKNSSTAPWPWDWPQEPDLTKPPPWIPSFAYPQFPLDATVHFDFGVMPELYDSADSPMNYGRITVVQNTAVNTNPTPPLDFSGATPAWKTYGDLRAVHLLDQITLTDRVSDFTINLGNGLFDREKLRIPGQINVNTASADVLAGIPAFANLPWINYNYNGTPVPLQGGKIAICAILAYRWRTTSVDPRIPLAYQLRDNAGNPMIQPGVSPPRPIIDYRNINPNTGVPLPLSLQPFPGYGIRSMAELLIPLSHPMVQAATNPTGVTSLDQRDALWANIANLCTVRSDTFVVYAYLEAIKVNPYYSVNNTPVTHNNSTDWYGLASDDPRGVSPLLPAGTTTPNVRVARHRWISIIDRSWSNDPNTPPRVVATRDLPQ